ncbi:MAG: hypothetical protein H6818_20550 [Phycisphaerales bacterium]|nr:hypothetical protein [Phycisphaerales bacterium]
MRIRDYLEQASTHGVPEWLLRETPSREGAAIRDEWARMLADPKADNGTRRLAAGMLRVRSERPTAPLLGRANARALRWVESAANRCRLAQQLRNAAPNAGLIQKIVLRLNGCAWRAAAAVILLFVKIGFFSAFDGVAKVMERLGQFHIDRHIGPLT